MSCCDNAAGKQAAGPAFGAHGWPFRHPPTGTADHPTKETYDVYQNRIFARRGYDRAWLGRAVAGEANYDYCTENPSAKGCPGNFDVTNEPFYTPPHAARSAHETHRAPRHHG